MAMKIAKELRVGLEFNRSANDFNSTCLQVVRRPGGYRPLEVEHHAGAGAACTLYQTIRRSWRGHDRESPSGGEGRLKRLAVDLCNRPSARIGVWKGTSHESIARELFPRPTSAPTTPSRTSSRPSPERICWPRSARISKSS